MVQAKSNLKMAFENVQLTSSWRLVRPEVQGSRAMCHAPRVLVMERKPMGAI